MEAGLTGRELVGLAIDPGECWDEELIAAALDARELVAAGFAGGEFTWLVLHAGLATGELSETCSEPVACGA